MQAAWWSRTVPASVCDDCRVKAEDALGSGPAAEGQASEGWREVVVEGWSGGGRAGCALKAHNQYRLALNPQTVSVWGWYSLQFSGGRG